MKTKLAQLKEHMAAGDHRAAIRLASKFGELGEHKSVITRAWAAIQHPEFYEAINKEPAVLVAAGVAAIRERYNLPGEEA